MDTSTLKKFAQPARRTLISLVQTKLKHVLAQGSAARRENSDAVKSLEQQISDTGEEQVIEKVAYTWFNRFCALRFMDANRFTRIGIVSPAEGDSQPEILAEAKAGHIDEDLVPKKVRGLVNDLLAGRTPSSDPQGEAYRLLLAAACNQWHHSMPFLFEPIADYTELLMPEDLLSPNSILAQIREAMPSDVCTDVEVIGWLYQFYISEKKDKVFDDQKKNIKVTPENIPAATQLFTPHWIVRYLVENSLGRLWMLNRPNSKLAEKMEYYIKPSEPEADFLKVSKPEEIKLCDPACGSGHMLTYAFDLLYLIYEEEGYQPSEIPELILTKNLHGIEIDERAGELAAFALTMKARSKQRTFFSKKIAPMVCVLKNVSFNDDEITPYMDYIGKQPFSDSLRLTLREFEEANNFGSLIRPSISNASGTIEFLQSKNISRNLFLDSTHNKVIQILNQASYLSQKYHVVIANPPYMGGKGMNSRLGSWVKEKFPDTKSDLSAMFIERNIQLAAKNGIVSMITMQSWMFLSSLEALRSKIVEQNTMLTMAHFGARAFDSIGGEVVSTTAFILATSQHPDFKGDYFRLVDNNSESQKDSAIREAIKNPTCGWFYRASASDFKKIPGSQIAYWISRNFASCFAKYGTTREMCHAFQGIITGNNSFFLRYWFEIRRSNVTNDFRSFENADGVRTWIPYNKGGSFRRWFRNSEYLLKWNGSGNDLTRGRTENREYFFKEGLTWSDITSSKSSFRISHTGSLFDAKGPTAFFDNNLHVFFLGLMNSVFVEKIIALLNPTLSFQIEDFYKIPVNKRFFDIQRIHDLVERCISISKFDLDSFETSPFFNFLPLLQKSPCDLTLQSYYRNLRIESENITFEIKNLEEENNRIFIEAYGLQDELAPDVPLSEITLTCNPHYRYGGGKTEEELEALLLADTIREYISYAVGCMFGRYSLDKPGLILANQGDTTEEYLKQIPNPTFSPDKDNVIPILDGDWFADEISERFKNFLRVTFGEESYQENLAFIETAIGKDVRKYFLKDFYSDHIKRYKKRPIYWLFSSPKGHFNALIYMHRYRPDSVSVILNDYLREFRTKLSAKMEHLKKIEASVDTSKSEKTKALKEIDVVKKMIEDLNNYERDTLFPLATKKIEIDLDDGVKVNYLKFGDALKKIAGLDASEDD